MTLNDDKTILTERWFLPAGSTDARGKMPVTLMVARAIEVATEHANALGVGYADLAPLGIGWVLARITVEVLRYPDINEWYSMETWIESYTRRFSDRCFAMYDAKGNVVANIRSVWVAIDFKTRAMADLSGTGEGIRPAADRRCPVGKIRIPAAGHGEVVAESTYEFKYTDVDFNRHVNTIKYLDLALNQWPLDWHDTHNIVRLSASFDHECRFGDIAHTQLRALGADSYLVDINCDGHRAVAVQLDYTPLRGDGVPAVGNPDGRQL